MDLFHQREVIKTLMSIAARTATSKLDGYHVLAARAGLVTSRSARRCCSASALRAGSRPPAALNADNGEEGFL